MAARKRTTRTTRNATTTAGKIDRIKAEAMGTVNTLVKQGNALRAKGSKLAAAKVKEARAAVSQLEQVFETRVSQAVARLGVPTAADMRALSRQVAQLQKDVQQLRRSRRS